jgi:hypothetical protein
VTVPGTFAGEGIEHEVNTPWEPRFDGQGLFTVALTGIFGPPMLAGVRLSTTGGR